MLINSRRRFRSPAAWALVVVFGAPALVEAQQSGLFPNAPINRERVPCPHEDPVYRLYRHQYFGYHPTCWRRFPEGWGCPSPEAPNVAQAFRDQPRDAPPETCRPMTKATSRVRPPRRRGPRADARGAPPRRTIPAAPSNWTSRGPHGRRNPTRCFPSPRPSGFPMPRRRDRLRRRAGGARRPPRRSCNEPTGTARERSDLASRRRSRNWGGRRPRCRRSSPCPASSPRPLRMTGPGHAMHATPARAPQRRGFLGGLFGGSGRRRR